MRVRTIGADRELPVRVGAEAALHPVYSQPGRGLAETDPNPFLERFWPKVKPLYPRVLLKRAPSLPRSLGQWST
jgi:hypothetical protein